MERPQVGVRTRKSCVTFLPQNIVIFNIQIKAVASTFSVLLLKFVKPVSFDIVFSKAVHGHFLQKAIFIYHVKFC